jgi:hypothetical protein
MSNTRDLGISEQLRNRTRLRTIGLQANRRLLDVQTVAHNCAIGEDAFGQVARPLEIDGQRTSALRFGDPRTQARIPALSARKVPRGPWPCGLRRGHTARSRPDS